MLGLVLISLWVAMHVVQGFLAARAMRDGKGDASLTISLLASAAPAVGLCFVLLIFVIGGASPTAQLNSGATRSLWSLWVGFWPLAMFSLSRSLPCSCFRPLSARPIRHERRRLSSADSQP